MNMAWGTQTKNGRDFNSQSSHRECMMNHVCSIDLTSHNISFTTLNINDEDESAYV